MFIGVSTLTMKFCRLAKLTLFFLVASVAENSAAAGIISEIHANPPEQCIAKSRDDMSSGIRNKPDGDSDEQWRGVMGAFAAVFLQKGAELMAPQNTTSVYTAVFYGGDPINEAGIYGYEFGIPIDSAMFQAREELNGKLHVVDGNLLPVLWSEKAQAAQECYRALDERISLKGTVHPTH